MAAPPRGNTGYSTYFITSSTFQKIAFSSHSEWRNYLLQFFSIIAIKKIIYYMNLS